MLTPDQKPELLAPAGDFEKLRFAFAYGADAVYAGLPMFSLRTKENRFDLEEVKRAIEYTHSIGKKIYITANIYAHNVKIEPFLNAMKEVVPLGADAYIMSDPGLIDIIKENHPEIEIHLSTQANNTNWAQARFWKKLGISRIILARELGLSEIKEIAERNPDIQTEMFVHGALCMAYSGRCMLSDYMTGRPSNSGACTQSCRWEYNVSGIQSSTPATAPGLELFVEEKKRKGQFLPVIEDEYGTYIFNSKDLCTLELMPQILATGVHSVKIEGRNKNFLYLATVVRAYRQAIDACWEGTFEQKREPLMQELQSLNQRGYTQGFLLGNLQDTVNYTQAGYATHAYAGKFVKAHDNQLVEIDVKNKISVGDEVEWLTPDRGVLKQQITRILNSLDQEISTISAGTNQWNPRIFTEHKLNNYCLMRLRISPSTTPGVKI